MIIRGVLKSVKTNKLVVESTPITLELLLDSNTVKFDHFVEGDRLIIATSENISKDVIQIPYNTVKVEKDTFKHIKDIRMDKYCDVIALCTSFKPLMHTKGTDSLFSLGLEDQSGSIELKVFTKEEEYGKLVEQNGEEPFTVGDVLLVRNIKKCSNNKYAVVAKPCIIEKTDNSPIQRMIFDFLTSMQNTQKLEINPWKTKSICDISDKSFFNVIGKVLNCNYDQVPVVYITDFTKNPLCRESGGYFPSNMVLVIKLFGRHSSLANKITPGKYFMFVNVRMNSFEDCLVAYMHDYLEGDVIEVTDPSLLTEIEKRETVYDESTKTNKKQNKSKRQSLVSVSIKDILDTGIFLSECSIVDVKYPSESNEFCIVFVEEDETIYEMGTKECLSNKIVNDKRIAAGGNFRTLIMRTASGNLYLIDMFVDDSEFDEFLNFYNQAGV